MRNNSYAISRLMIWAEWLLRKDQGATGYPRQCNYTKLVQIRGGLGYSVDIDQEATNIDKFMTQLKKENETLFEVASMCYNIKWVDQGHGIKKAMYTNVSNQTSVAQQFGCSQSTINDKLNKVYDKLIDYLHDH